MSAIYGIISKTGKPIEPEQVSKLRHAMAHRATDGQGVWENGNAALGFCKLVVYPQQQNEQLPVEAGHLVLTADARIDNRDELYSLLSLDKLQWQHEADSYLILKAYQKWGEQCVEHLQGEFVFAVWNKESHHLFIAADHMGFRPVFYYNGPDQFIFCSEIKGVVAAKTTPNYFNEEHLINYHFRQSDAAQTYNKEVFALCGGNTICLKRDQLAIKKYWTLENRGRYNFTRDEDWIACLRDLMYKAVAKHLNPEVPIGVTLSGGLDSSSVACILSELLAKHNKPLYTFSSVLPLGHGGIEIDERNYIEIVNKHCPNIIQTFVEAPGVGPLDNVADAFEKDESIPNGFFYMDQAIAVAAQQKNIKNLFTGFGGDFWVSWKGHSVVYQLVNEGNYKAALMLIKELAITNKSPAFKFLKSDYLIYTGAWKQLRKLKPKANVDSQQQTALKPELVNKYKPLTGFSVIPDQRKVMKIQLEEGRIARLTGMFANRNGSYGMGTADIMFDKDIMEFLVEAPIELFNKAGWRRSLIRHAMEGVLPSEIQWRRDKLPYNPDFARRGMNSKARLYELMNADKSKQFFNAYFDRGIIEKHFDDIKPFAGFSSQTSVTGIRIIQAGIACSVLSYLNGAFYRFDGCK
jgi:asparagine synthase (glutamine-hydrolysing)